MAHNCNNPNFVLLSFLQWLLVTVVLINFATCQEICQTTECKHFADELRNRSMNTSVSPCDDFYEYVCGNWAQYHPLISEDPTGAGRTTFGIRAEQVEHEMEQAIRNAAERSNETKSHSVRFASQLYLECNDTVTVEAKGMAPLKTLLDSSLGGWPLLTSSNSTTTTRSNSTKRWPELFTRLFSATGVSPLFRIGVQYDPKIGVKQLYVGPGGTGLSGSVFTKPTPKHKQQIEAYRKFIKASALLMGAVDEMRLEQAIDKIIHLEEKIAQTGNHNQTTNHREYTFAELNTITEHRIDWLATVNSMLSRTNSTLPPLNSTDRIFVFKLTDIQSTLQVLDQTETEDIQSLLAWLVVAVFGSLTTEKFRVHEAEFNTVRYGMKISPPRRKDLCYNVVNNGLPFALGRIYVDTHFTPAEKKAAVILVEELKSSFQQILHNNTWLDDQTRQLALEKLSAIRENVAYPEWVVRDAELDQVYSFLSGVPVDVPKGSFFESSLTLFLLAARHEFDLLRQPLNHSLMWPMNPATINAAYSPTENSITIPAAVLSSPFFEAERPFAMNYGAIGSIIGHEFTHGFDNMGRQFDLDGHEKDWWTNATLEEFNNKTGCFVRQYGAIEDPVAGMHINGRQTLGENIADNGGVKEAFNAFHNHEAKYGRSPVLPDLKLSADQLFFVSYARNWCSVYGNETLSNMIKYNPHPPDRYRVNVVLGNSHQFAQVFQCPVGSRMNPKDKCTVW